MVASQNVLIVAEQSAGEPRRMALELATKACQLAAEGGGQLSAVVVGPGARQAAEKLGEYGVARAFVSEDERFARLPGAAEAAAVEKAIELSDPGLVLFGSSTAARDVSGMLSARLGIGVIAGAIDVGFQQGVPVATCPVFGGTLEETKGWVGNRGIALMRPNAVEAERAPSPGPVAVEEIDLAFDEGSSAEVIETALEADRTMPVEEAAVVVAVGRGLGGPEAMPMARELAEALGGTLGSTRAAVDAGWLPYATQIGQTGKTVKPRLFIALGVSGAIQHRVGMQTSDVIVAINKNPDAAIFQYSDFSVVGDLFDVVPKLTEEIRRRRRK